MRIYIDYKFNKFINNQTTDIAFYISNYKLARLFEEKHQRKLIFNVKTFVFFFAKFTSLKQAIS